MHPRTARALVAASLVVAASALAALAWWPSGEPRADLVSSAPTTSTTTTAPAPTAPIETTTTIEPPAPPLTPTRLKIPAIGVDAPVVPVGLNPDGSMEIPGATEVGWYEPGTRPGEPEGSAVLAAHVDYAGQRGAFFDLRSLPDGAEVIVESAEGPSLRFVVGERFQVDKDELPVDELFRSSGPEVLTLITCGGAFDRSIRSYDDNIVVRADPAV